MNDEHHRLAEAFREELAFVVANVARGSATHQAIEATMHRLAMRLAPPGEERSFIHACGIIIEWQTPTDDPVEQAKRAMDDRQRSYQFPPASGYFDPNKRRT